MGLMEPEPDATPSSPHAFTPPDVAPKIEFKKVRVLRKSRKRTRFRALVAVGVAFVLVATAVTWVGVRGWRAAGHLRAAAQDFATLKQQVTAGDAKDARTTLAKLQREVRAAHDDTGDPAWAVATGLPWVGDDLRAARTIAKVLDDVASRGLPPIIDIATGMESAVLGSTKTVDLSVLRDAGPRLTRAAAIIKSDRVEVEAIDPKGLDRQIRASLPTLLDGLETVERLSGPAAQAAQLLPAMLGADGPRTYLVLFQNLAEARATGGMPGAFVVVKADHGAVTIVDQGTAASSLGVFDTPVLPLDPDMEATYTDRIGTYPADINLTPDFPTAAATAREMYRRRTGRTVDGVLATDPVALSYVLRATGPVPLPGYQPLDASTAVRQLLNQAYLDIPDEAQQDAYFAGAAKAVFDALVGHHVDAKVLVAALARAAGERRSLVWSAHPDEQAEIAKTTLAGSLPLADGTHPVVGVFLDDGSGAKLDYYLTHEASLVTGVCGDDGSMALGLTVKLGSTAPRTGLPKAVTGLALSGDPYTIRTNVMIFSPAGGAIIAGALDGKPIDLGAGYERGRSVSVVTVDLAPGASKTLQVALLTGVPATAAKSSVLEPRLVTTPSIAPWPGTAAPAAGCTK